MLYSRALIREQRSSAFIAIDLVSFAKRAVETVDCLSSNMLCRVVLLGVLPYLLTCCFVVPLLYSQVKKEGTKNGLFGKEYRHYFALWSFLFGASYCVGTYQLERNLISACLFL